MKKTITSIVILMAVLISAFAVFTIPASADDDNLTLTDGAVINVSNMDHYYEAIVPARSQQYSFTLHFEMSGTKIIQTFSSTGIVRLTLCDANGVELVTETQSQRKGENANKPFFTYNFDSTAIYILKVKTSSTIPARLSITTPDDDFYLTTPVENYSQIKPLTSLNGSASISKTFYLYGNETAVVRRYIVNQSGTKLIHTEGCDGMKLYIMNPRSNSIYDGVLISGEDTVEYNFVAGVEYYLVMFHSTGGHGLDPAVEHPLYIELSVTIG